MRINHFFGLLSVAALLVAACGGDDPAPAPDPEPPGPGPAPEATYSTVSLRLTGEVAEAASLSAADRYLVQADAKAEGGGIYARYAYGVFDNAGDLKLRVKDGDLYRFEVRLLVDAANKVASSVLEHIDGDASGTAVTLNQFVLSSTAYNHYMAGSLAMTYPSEGTYTMPHIDQYVGRASDYKASGDGAAEVAMKRTAFGLRFDAADFTEGTLTIDAGEAGTYTLAPGAENAVEEIVSFREPWAAYEAAYDYSESLSVSVTWTVDGTATLLESRSFDVKRDRLTTVEIHVPVPDHSLSLTISENELGAFEDGGTVNITPD